MACENRQNGIRKDYKPFLVTVNDVRICISNPEAILSLGWIYEDTIMFLMLLFGPLVMAVVAVFLISREYTEKTLKTIFVVPIGRRQFIMGKFIILFILILLFMVLSWLDIVVISVICNLFMHCSFFYPYGCLASGPV